MASFKKGDFGALGCGILAGAALIGLTVVIYFFGADLGEALLTGVFGG